MSNADTGTDDGAPETVQINLRLGKPFLDDIDATWKEQGFNSRSEFLRYSETPSNTPTFPGRDGDRSRRASTNSGPSVPNSSRGRRSRR